MPTHLPSLLALALLQSTPNGGAITKYVPPVPTPASFISDQRSVLTPDQRQQLDARIRMIQTAGFGDIAVALLPSIGDYSANQVAVEIYRTWKVGSVAAIGSVHRNVGVLLLIVPKELAPDHRGQCWINTGTGSEGIITDASAGTLCRDSIIPHLLTRDYAGAVGAGIAGLEAKLRGDTGLTTTTTTAVGLRSTPDDGGSGAPSKAPYGIIAIAGLVFLLIGGRQWTRYHRRNCPRCGKRMRRLDENDDDAKLKREELLEEGLGSVDYDVWVCECGNSDVIPYRNFFSKYSECPRCHRRAASSTRQVMYSASVGQTGLAEDRFNCKACGQNWIYQIVLPAISASSSSSSSSSGGGGGGGGGSFGGSGSTSGGGGGGSY